MALQKPVLWIALGNPYVLKLFPQVPAYLCTFSYSDGSQLAAARAMSGEIAINGKTPVSIPGYFAAGDGLQVPKLELTLRPGTESPDLRPDTFDETRRLLASYVSQGAFPGGALAVGYRGALVLDAAAGKLETTPAGSEVTGDTMYDLASLSKVIGTTSAAMMLFDSGRLLLDASVQDYLPEFKGPDKDKVKVSNLLQHTSGLPAWLPLYKEAKGYEECLKRIYETPLEFTPGSRRVYSDLGMILLGEILTRAAGRPFDRYLADQLFGPMGLKSTLYKPPSEMLSRIAPTQDDPWRGRVVRGEVHDENAYAMGGVAGHAGLFSTTHDLAVFAQLMLNRGLYDHRRYFRPDTVDRFTGAPGAKNGAEALGWQKPSDTGWTCRVFSPAANGHTGITGTSIWIDPQRQLFIILLTNRVHPSRANTMIEEARRTLAESVMRALGLQP